MSDWANNGLGCGGGGGRDTRQYGKRPFQLKTDVCILNEQQDSEESNPNSIHSAPSTTWARTTLVGKALTNRNPNIPVIPPEVLEDDASRKTKAQKTSKNSRVRLNSNEIVENDSPAVEIAMIDSKTENGHLNQPHRLMRSTSCRSMPSKVNQQNLKIVVTKGHRDDVAFLLQQIDTFLAATGWFDFFLFLPNGWHFANSERLRTWLESAGFEEPVPGKFVFPDHRAIKELRKLLFDRSTQKSPIASRERSVSLAHEDRKNSCKPFPSHQPSASLPPAPFPPSLQIFIPTNASTEQTTLSNGPTPRSNAPTPRSNAPTPRLKLPVRGNHSRHSSNALSQHSLIDPATLNRFPRDDGSSERTESPTEPDTPQSIGQKSPYDFSGPPTASTNRNLHNRRLSSPLEYSFINQFSQSNLKSSDDNSVPIIRHNSYASVSSSSQSDDNFLNEKFRSITTSDIYPGEDDSQGTDFNYSQPNAQDSYLEVSAIEQSLKIFDDTLKYPRTGHDSDMNDSDTSTVIDISYISENGDAFHGDPLPFLDPVSSHAPTSFKKSSSFADCPILYEMDLKDPYQEPEQDLNDLYSSSRPPPIPRVGGLSEKMLDFHRDGSAISPQVAVTGLFDEGKPSYFIGKDERNGDAIKFFSKSERDSREGLRAGQAANNRKVKGSKRHVSDSAVKSCVSSMPESAVGEIHPGSVTPGAVSLSQNAVDRIDPQKAVHYQTPQAMRCKFENSKAASPKDIEFLVKRLGMFCTEQEDLPLGDSIEPICISILANEKELSNFGGCTFPDSGHCMLDLEISENARKLSLLSSSSCSGGKSLIHSTSSPALSDMFYDCHHNPESSSSGALRRSGSNSAINDALSNLHSFRLKRSKSMPNSFTDSCDNSLIMDRSSHMDMSMHSSSNTIVGTEAGFCSCEEENVGPDDAGSRKDKKRRMSILKYGRMSVKRGRGVQQLHSNGFSPSATCKVRLQRRRRGQAGNVSRDDVAPFAMSGLDHDSSLDQSHQNHSRLINLNISADAHSVVEDVSKIADDSHMLMPSTDLNEHSFMGTVIGGVYQHCFDNQCPVVAPPSSTDNRVVGLHFTALQSIILHMFVPKRNKIENVEFSADWKSIRASPIGYLLTEKSHMQDYRHAVYYYIPKHPNDWNSENDEPGARGFDICMESRPFHIPCEEGIYQPFSSEQDDDEDGYGMHMDLEVPMETKTDPCPGWYNSSIMRFVLEYLVDARTTTAALPAVTAPPAKSDSRKNHRRQIGASQDSDSFRSTLRSASPSNAVVPGTASQDAAFFNKCQPFYSVCKAWALSVHMLSAQRLSNVVDSPSSMLNYELWTKFVTTNSCGDFLGDGACKNVYAVKQDTIAESRVIAVSVMDVNKLVDDGMDCAIRHELEISMLCSSLVTLNICPNLVSIYSMFQSEYPAPESLWRSGDVLGDSGSGSGSGRAAVVAKSVSLLSKYMMNRSKGRYQFCCMEFCSGGDIEGMIRKEKLLETSVVRSFLFQMCFALYSCREKLSLRHFDIKLLNFLVTRGSSVMAQPLKNSSVGGMDGDIPMELHVGFGRHVYNLPLTATANEHSLVKLADFGTSIIGEKCLGDNINKMQFTTLENTPPEFLLLGSGARQCFSSDTFPLGLCFLHLLTGHQPYEELMKNVHCPPYLASKLASLWYTEDAASPFHVIREVIVSILPSDATGSVQMTASSGAVLFDTLYRYMVLSAHSLGGDSSDQRGSSPLAVSACSAYSSSAVWTAVVEALGLALDDAAMDIVSDKRSIKSSSRFSQDEMCYLRSMGSEKRECLRQFKRDLGKWSIRFGEDRKMKSLRARLEDLGGGAAQLLESMLHFDPSKRCTMYDALSSSVFHDLRSDIARPFKYSPSSGAVPYMHYYHPDSTDGYPDSLPIL